MHGLVESSEPNGGPTRARCAAGRPPDVASHGGPCISRWVGRGLGLSREGLRWRGVGAPPPSKAIISHLSRELCPFHFQCSDTAQTRQCKAAVPSRCRRPHDKTRTLQDERNERTSIMKHDHIARASSVTTHLSGNCQRSLSEYATVQDESSSYAFAMWSRKLTRLPNGPDYMQKVICYRYQGPTVT